ncbi:hypothetical protein LTR36_006448 [Oleoguttula mirabilis]|uniref:Transcription factor BYE1 n=1 Tax=Oleoguttula mirabilis TaxID=1507867 RepID=A0AAV9JWI1_9PEZI|nr:hypothetical protein LTR36_006448 [Oleoguttula mirabilis]
MSDSTRRSGRANKGVHTKASSSPAPPNPNKPAGKATKTKGKKSAKAEAEEEDGEEDVIRCICGDDNPQDKRPFIGCEACLVWQHNVCMGEPQEEDDVPDHYFCEECRPEEHKETLIALAQGRRIWEERTNQWKQWRKMSASRRKSKGKGEDAKPTWLKKDVPDEEEPVVEEVAEVAEVQETGTKRKRESVKPESEPVEVQPEPVAEVKPTPQMRPDKRRKSSQAPSKVAADADTAIMDIDHLPPDRKKVAEALSKIIAEDVQDKAKAGFRIPDGHTAKSLGERDAGLIEYSLFMRYGEPTTEKYKSQFRALNANLKKNKVLLERLLAGSLTADDLAGMESKDMASEEAQRERIRMKEELDRQIVAVEEDDGPKMRRTHKGDEVIEDETYRATDFTSAPVRERTGMGEDGGSPVNGQGGAGSPIQSEATPLAVDTKRPSHATLDRRASSQQFDMNNIWQKTAPSPTTTGARPMQVPPRRRSSIVQQASDQNDGAKDDPDVDRMLQDDDDENYSPAEYTADDTIVWRGKLVHTGEGEPMVNARFVAGRDLTSTVAWREMLPEKLSIDGRLQVAKAEEYLCGLQWSHSSDVSVIALTPYDDAEAFKAVFEYFQSRGRYAVVNKDKPQMVKDLYIIPVEVGGNLPEHIEKLEHCTIKQPVEERLLLATFVVQRAPGTPQVASDTPSGQQPAGTNGQQHHLPQHMRSGVQGPAGSPLATNAPTFSPSQQNAPPTAGYGVPVTAPSQSPFPPNPYNPQPPPAGPEQQAEAFAYPPQGALQAQPTVAIQPHPNPLVAEVLGPYQHAQTAHAILTAAPDIGREKLENLRKILEEDVAARTDMDALSMKLMGGAQ